MDQAAGLRQWASRQEAGAPGASVQGCPDHVVQALLALARQHPDGGSAGPRSAATAPPSRAAARPVAAAPRLPAGAANLLVIGLPPHRMERVRGLLAHWGGQGRRWVGDPQAWQLVPIDAHSPHLGLLAAQQARWALWVEADAEAFRRAWRLLIAVAERPGPRRLLLVHPPGLSRQGLLDNLQQAAAHYLGIDLVVLA